MDEDYITSVEKRLYKIGLDAVVTDWKEWRTGYDQRVGQALANALIENSFVVPANVDPFYFDGKIEACITYLEESGK